ncbi:MAG TPA: alpha/beta hydrolase [Chthoniobacterales bacterium]|nr:alpha/beta hydrolase [Chthoniobacterales bacterium]
MSDPTFIHQFVAPQSNASGRVLLLLHGTGGDENDMIPLGRDLDPEAGLLSLRGNVSENGMPRFFRRFAEGVFDEEDIVRRAKELADFIGEAAVRYDFNPARMTAVGYSNGANIAAAVLLLHGAVFKSAILLRAMVPLTPPQLPGLAGVRVLICSGRCDKIIPVDNAEGLAALLREGGADVVHRFEESGHQLVFDEIARASAWLRESSATGKSDVR